MHALLTALQFLTRLPLPAPAAPDAAMHGRSVLYYPLVGLLIGLLLAALAMLLAPASVPMSAALVLVGWVLITGGLHLDGLADSADAWLGGHGDRARTLEIMKDPASGPAGVSAVVLVLLLKYTALLELVAGRDWLALCLAPVLGRAALVLLLWNTPYVRPGGLGAAQSARLSRQAPVILLLFLAAAVVLLQGWRGAGLLAMLAVLWLGLRRQMLQRIGGTTGDTLGASCEITEAAVLVFLALASGFASVPLAAALATVSA